MSKTPQFAPSPTRTRRVIGGTDATFAAFAVLRPSTAEAAYAVVPHLSLQAPHRVPSARVERNRA